MLELNEGNFVDVMSQNKVVVVDFWASWCGPCRALAPTYDRWAKDTDPNLALFAKCETDAALPVVEQCGINVLPTVIVFKDGKEVARLEGVSTPEQMQKTLFRAIA